MFAIRFLFSISVSVRVLCAVSHDPMRQERRARCQLRRPALIHSFISFNLLLHVLGGLPLSRSVFKGPSFKKKKYTYTGKIQLDNK